MDLIKQLTGKNPNEYKFVAKKMIDESDHDLFEKLVNQDGFLFDFIKDNVAKRIYEACTQDNYKNLLNFLDIYSPSYANMIVEVLYKYSDSYLFSYMKNLFYEDNSAKKAYAIKYFSCLDTELIMNFTNDLIKLAFEEDEILAQNAAEVLSKLKDKQSIEIALDKLNSTDDFEQLSGVKFLVNYQATEYIDKIIEVMKRSKVSEYIAMELLNLIDIEEYLNKNVSNAILFICYLVNSLSDIIPLSVLTYCDFVNMYSKIINIHELSEAAVLLRLSIDKFSEFANNEEYLYDCDKKTKDVVQDIYSLLKNLNVNKLNSLLYDELYEESDFVFFAIDYVDEIQELETLLESNNPTLIIKTLSILKSKDILTENHKNIALKYINDAQLIDIVKAL